MPQSLIIESGDHQTARNDETDTKAHVARREDAAALHVIPPQTQTAHLQARSPSPDAPTRTARNNINNSSNIRHAASTFEILLFFFCGLGSSLCYISTLASLVFFKAQYGNESYIYLNLAIYVPLLPVSIAQARYDQDLDKLFGSANAFLCRGTVGFVISILSMALVPRRTGLVWVCIWSILIGAAGAILQGILYQMAAFVTSCSASAGYLKAAVAAGIQASALLSLIVSLMTGFGSSDVDTQDDLRRFNHFICVVESLIFGLFVVLMGHSRRVHTAMLRRDSSLSLVDQFGLFADNEADNGDIAPLLLSEESSKDEGFHQDQDYDQDQRVSSQRVELTYPQLWRYSTRFCYSLLLTLVPSFLVGSWFTKVKTDLVILPQILFYCRIISDFASRLLTLYKSPSSQHELLTLSGCRLILVVVFFVNALYFIFPHRDALSIILVCMIAFGSGYLVTGCYQLAPTALPSQYRERNVTKQAAMLNLAFSASALVGLFVSLSLAGLGL